MIYLTTTNNVFDLMKIDSWMYNSSDTVPRYVENPEWKKDQIRKKIELNNRIINQHEERVVELKEEVKKLKKDLEEMK